MKDYFAKDNAERWYDTVGKDWIGYHKKRDVAEVRSTAKTRLLEISFTENPLLFI